MRHRAIVLTAAAAVVSVTSLPATVAAQATPAAASGANGVPGRLDGSTVLPAAGAGLRLDFRGAGTSSTAARAAAGPTGATLDGPPPVHAMTGASGAPAISSRTPARSATSVSRTTNVKVRFTKAVKASSILIRLRDYVNGTYIAGKLTYASATRTATFNPTPTLRSHRKYVVVVSGAKDSAGHVMRKSTWSFTTRP